MVAALYTPRSYRPEVFARLRHIEEAYQILEGKAAAKEDLSLVRSSFLRHGVQRKLGVMVLHKHFDMTPDEKLVGFGSVTTPWALPGGVDADQVFGGKVVPRSWAFSDGHLYPIEFGFNPPGVENFPRLEFKEEFVRELYDLFRQLEIDDVIGLTVLDDEIHEVPYGVEKTVGRVSITLPSIPETQPIDAIESVWTFGCHERMDDSKMWPARVCWVCQSCK